MISSLAVIGPEPTAETESALHLFPAAESTLDLGENGASPSGIDLDHAEVATSDLNAHTLASSDRPADDFAAAETDELELPSDDLPVEPSAADQPADSAWSGDDLPIAGSLDDEAGEDAHLETERGDFLTSFDAEEPPAGDAEEAIPLTAGDLSSESVSGGFDPAGLPSDAFGDALDDQADDQIAFATEEDEAGFDTVDLDTGFEETREIPEGVEGYALDQESAEAEEASELRRDNRPAGSSRSPQAVEDHQRHHVPAQRDRRPRRGVPYFLRFDVLREN